MVIVGGRQTLDVGDRWQGLMGDGKEAGRDSTIDGREGNSLIRDRASREATGGRRGGCGVAHNGIADVLGSRRGGGADARVFAGLRRGRRADVSGRGREGVEQLRVLGALLSLTASSKIAAPGDEEACQDDQDG